MQRGMTQTEERAWRRNTVGQSITLPYSMKGFDMVELLALTCGAFAAGVGIYKYLTQGASMPAAVPVGAAGSRKQMTPVLDDDIQSRNAQSHNTQSRNAQSHNTQSYNTQSRAISFAAPIKQTITVEQIPHTQEEREALQHGIYTSSISLGLASAGLFFFPPLHYASIPILIYMGVPSARQAYDVLYEQGRPSRALAETAALAICLGGGWYLAGSLGFCCYYLGRLNRFNHSLAQRLQSMPRSLPPSARLFNGTKEVMVPTDTVQGGDEVLVETSEIIPVDGVILEGVAWIQPSGSKDASSCRLMRIGDRVLATDLVIAGRLSLCAHRID